MGIDDRRWSSDQRLLETSKRRSGVQPRKRPCLSAFITRSELPETTSASGFRNRHPSKICCASGCHVSVRNLVIYVSGWWCILHILGRGAPIAYAKPSSDRKQPGNQ